MELPFAEHDDLEVGRRDDELLVRVGPYRRSLLLPDSLRRRMITDATLREGRLKVVFAGDEPAKPATVKKGRARDGPMSSSNERPDPAREGFEHLQAAAHEMIAAARSMLDACEELLEDPRPGETLASMVGSVARVVGGITGLVPTGAPAEHDDDDGPRVQRIKIS